MGEIVPFIGDVWFWFIVGVALLIGELLAPGIFLLWLAIAAGLTDWPMPSSAGLEG